MTMEVLCCSCSIKLNIPLISSYNNEGFGLDTLILVLLVSGQRRLIAQCIKWTWIWFTLQFPGEDLELRRWILEIPLCNAVRLLIFWVVATTR
ncbi:hypothetical protein MKW98_008564 [Papaver atlanticum]|uniref:Uncharacterized protein n=1 Tax=Papaver atlanticum TaxID=357466 RepID=A0AAD4T9X6_9MAGN|nr:hypothetical protein MKW98_008564 [Papaver atlanticum]